MVSNLNIIALLGLTSVLFGCQEQYDLCDAGNTISVAREELKDALVEDLQAAKIPIQEETSGEICYPASKADYVKGRLIALDLQQRPPNQITITGGRFSVAAFERLEQAGIEFKSIEKNGEVVVVFEDENTAVRAFEVIGGVSQELYGPNMKADPDSH